jgi:hypothetical protein
MLARLLKRSLRTVLMRSYPLSFWHELRAAYRQQRGAARQRLLARLFDCASERRYLRLFRDVNLAEALRGQTGTRFADLFGVGAEDVVLGCWEARVVYSIMLTGSHQHVAIERFVDDELLGGGDEDLLRQLVTEQLERGPDVVGDGAAAALRLLAGAAGIATESAVAAGRNVHFLLDGLELAATPAAVEELRYIHRRWSQLDRQPGRILFHLGGRTTAPPWRDECALPASDWAQLGGRRAEAPHEGDLVEAGATHELLAAAAANAPERLVEVKSGVVAQHP